MTEATVDSKGRIVIPEEIRKELNLGEGSKLNVSVSSEDDAIIIRSRLDPDRFIELTKGFLKEGSPVKATDPFGSRTSGPALDLRQLELPDSLAGFQASGARAGGGAIDPCEAQIQGATGLKYNIDVLHLRLFDACKDHNSSQGRDIRATCQEVRQAKDFEDNKRGPNQAILDSEKEHVRSGSLADRDRSQRREGTT